MNLPYFCSNLSHSLYLSLETISACYSLDRGEMSSPCISTAQSFSPIDEWLWMPTMTIPQELPSQPLLDSLLKDASRCHSYYCTYDQIFISWASKILLKVNPYPLFLLPAAFSPTSSMSAPKMLCWAMGSEEEIKGTSPHDFCSSSSLSNQ